MPKVSVGILKSESIRFSTSEKIETVSYSEGRLLWHGNLYSELRFSPQLGGCFIIYDVVIGIGFHWERKEAQTFQGTLRFVVEGNEVRAINDIDVEDYLLSVISSEMSASATEEFLKAHAVISRSWLLNRMTTQKNDASTISHVTEGKVIRWYDHDDHTLFDVCADDHCQRYQGISRAKEDEARWDRVKEVILATKGQVLTYKGQVCDARFSKCCGGVMEEYESCWDETHHDYLVAKKDPYCNTRDVRILAQVLNNYDQETVDFYRWTVEYTAEELSELVCRKSGIDFGQVIDLIPVKVGPSGRIIELKIVGEKCTVIVGKELEIRKWLSESHLYSSAFEVERICHGDVSSQMGDASDNHSQRLPSSRVDIFILRGKGWGHGVGLCQIGAAVMGDQGFGYEQILEHYYPNSKIETKW